MSDDQQAGGTAQQAPGRPDTAGSRTEETRDRDERPGDGDHKAGAKADRKAGAKADRKADAKADGKAGGDDAATGDETTEQEKDQEKERQRERERAAGRFKEHTRDPLAGEDGEDGPTDLASAARTRRATRLLFDIGRDYTGFDRSYFRSAHIGDTFNLRLDTRTAGAGLRGGPVPDEELRRLRRIHVEPEGYVLLRNALRAQRLLVLGAAPGTGRASTALSLLDEVTTPGADGANPGPPSGSRIRRVDPADGVRQLATSLDEPRGGEDEEGERPRRATGYLLELSFTRPGVQPPDEMDLDELAAALERCEAYAVIVVTVGSATNSLLAGRYGMLCPPAPTRELVHTRLRELLERHAATAPDATASADELFRRAVELMGRAEVKDAIGLKHLRPAEAELLASLLAGHVRGDLPYEELLSGCRSLAARQAQEWFAGVDRALTVPPAQPDGTTGRPGTATLFHPVAFRIALAVLGGASYSAVAAAAHLLTWELSVQSDPDHTPARPLFCDDPEADLALSRAELADGTVEVAGAEVPARLIWYQGSALPTAVLTELWDRHFPVRAPVVRWLRQLADDPRTQVWMRAAVAAGELCVRDFDHGYAELVRPLAEATTPRRRIFAATTLDQAAGHDSHRRAVHRLVDDWSRNGTKTLRWTAAMTLGYGNAAPSTDDALDALARIGVHDDGDQTAVASFNVVRLLALPDAERVLERMSEWTHHKREAYQDLGLVTTVRLSLTTVDEVLTDHPASPLGERGDWPLPLALADTRPELVRPMADLMWTTLNTARAREVATDALERLLRSAVREDGTEWTRPGLAVLLPALVTEEHDRWRLDWLLRRMMHDPDNPLPDPQARDLWWLAVTPPDRQRPDGPHRDDMRRNGPRPQRTRRERNREEDRHG
ncbi:hypothetical protein [Streptomyces echinoruber]|uniref:Uncharacterized protein n=1 Tax=Streptomyces echinoruber TaxID=68898 RepID=A0A918VCR7_9ACTN|nr:hypothetical protein [Streptomyces echinoruber]GGZ87245.1 hypothetical protein GCM10010389_27000 [Streptomyces echinoruber]